MQRIVLASNNRGKLKELHHYLAPLEITLVPQIELGVSEVEETGLTFIENAIIKARHATSLTGLPAIADDSGLVVDVLNGAPGITSARYAGPHADDHANVKKLLLALTEKSASDRSAHFHCVLVYLRHAKDPTPIIAQASWNGSILQEPTGTLGFGYDPIFYVPTHHCSAAELELTEKNRISHRGQALAKLVGELLKKKL